MACDIRVMDEQALLVPGFIALGLAPDTGVSAIGRRMGTGRALRWLATNERMDAASAERHGIVDEVAPAGTAVEVAQALAARICDGPPHAVAATKRLLRAEPQSLADRLAAERATQLHLLGTDDHAEGLSAFTERRPPTFRGT